MVKLFSADWTYAHPTGMKIKIVENFKANYKSLQFPSCIRFLRRLDETLHWTWNWIYQIYESGPRIEDPRERRRWEWIRPEDGMLRDFSHNCLPYSCLQTFWLFVWCWCHTATETKLLASKKRFSKALTLAQACLVPRILSWTVLLSSAYSSSLRSILKMAKCEFNSCVPIFRITLMLEHF